MRERVRFRLDGHLPGDIPAVVFERDDVGAVVVLDPELFARPPETVVEVLNELLGGLYRPSPPDGGRRLRAVA